MDNTGYLKEILSKIQQGKVVLFLGAGASHSAGGPSGKKLTDMIKAKFPKINQSLSDFIEVCQDVIDTPPYNRNDLEEFIKNHLMKLQPTVSHKIMTQFDWAAIFTTNFDDLIEISYRINTTDSQKHCHTINSDRFRVNPSDRSKTYLFKIMGSITSTEDDNYQMVLSRADYNSALIKRKKYFEIISDFVKTGIIVFIGYSFNDRLVLDVIDDLIQTYGMDRLPWSYAFFDKVDLNDEKIRHKFSSRRIIPIELNFDDFFNFLDKNKDVTFQQYNLNTIKLKLKGETIIINESDERQYSEFFEILDEDKINQSHGDKDKFFMGNNNSWGAFKENWDFKRDIYISSNYKNKKNVIIECLKDRIIDEIHKFDIENNKVILIKGMAGVGKTMMLKRIAYDIYSNGEAPVIIVNSERSNFDYKLFASFIESINHQLNEKNPDGKHKSPIKLVIIIDDAASHIRHVNHLKDYLSSRGRPVLILATERTSEWDIMQKSFPFNIPSDNIYELDEKLSDIEKVNIIDHFFNLGYVNSKGPFWDDIIKKEYENSIFATIYTLVHPSKKPLNLIIQDQFINLTELTKKAFQYICFFHQFNLPINQELLVRSLKCDYDIFINDVIIKDSAKVIFEEKDKSGNILYKTHHRIIAKKTIEMFFQDPEIQKNVFLEIFSDTNFSNQKESEICEKLLIEHIGPNAHPQIFTYNQQHQIFSTICEKNSVRSIVHHWGVLEADNNNLFESEELLKKALNIPRDDIESFRGESDQNILTSLGNLYSKLGIDYMLKGKTREAEDYFEKAENSFHDAKHGEFPNVYAYHSHAHMWYLKGNKTRDEIEKIDNYAKALRILSYAKDNINDEELQQIYELETTIWTQIGDETKINNCLEVLKEKYKSASGYYLNAELLLRKAEDKEGDDKRKTLELALRKIEKGLKIFQNDEHCLRLSCKLLRILFPENINVYYESLTKWKSSVTTQNSFLLYELGRISFLLGYYESSMNFFKELETGVGMGNKLRSRPSNPIIDEKGNKKEFIGTITKIISSYEGYIKCDSLRNLQYKIAFRPIASNFTPSSGNSVKFNIEFSYRGPRAENVKKL